MKGFILLLTIAMIGLAPGPNGGNTTIHVPAAGMKNSVLEFENEFSWLYSHQSQPIPLASLMYHASVLPVNASDAKLLDTTASGQARTATFADGGKSIVSDGQAASGIAFPVLLNGVQSSIGVDCPAHLAASLSVQQSNNAVNSVVFSFSQPLVFHLDKINMGFPLPKTLYLQQISVSNAAIVYQLSDGTSSSSSQYTLSLDVATSSGGTL